MEKLKINLDGKSAQYLAMLRRCIEKYKEADRRRLKLFLKYASPNTGVVSDRMGLLQILLPTMLTGDIVGAWKLLLVVQPDSLAAFIIVNGTLDGGSSGVGDRELLEKTCGYKIVCELKKEEVYRVLEKVDALIWIRRRAWQTSIEKVCFISLAEELIYLQKLGAGVGMGYTFDDLPPT